MKADADAVYMLIDKMKHNIILKIEPENKLACHAYGAINLYNMKGKDNKSVVDNEDFQFMANDLENKLVTFKTGILTLLDPSENELVSYINKVIMTGEDWKNTSFNSNWMISVIDRLNAIKSNVAFVASETFESL